MPAKLTYSALSLAAVLMLGACSSAPFEGAPPPSSGASEKLEAPAAPDQSYAEAIPSADLAAAAPKIAQAPASAASTTAGAVSTAPEKAKEQKDQSNPPPSTVAQTEGRVPAAQRITRYLSADDSNSQASPVIARKSIELGRYIDPSTVRSYEFLNYFDFDFPPAPPGEARLHAALRGLGSGRYSLLAAVRSENRSFAAMAPIILTVLIDESGSMAGPSMELAKLFTKSLASRLRPSDKMAIVSFARKARVLLPARGADQALSAEAAKSLALLSPNDVTDIESGLRLAYETAESQYRGGAVNRVVLVSDGGANAGKLAQALISKKAEDSEKQGIYLVGVGVGVGFNDSLMNKVTDAGRGAYVFVDSANEIERLLGDAVFPTVFDVALRDVRLKMTLPALWSVEEFHGEAMSATASDIVPQYLSPSDQMLYHMILKGPESLTEGSFDFEVEYAPMGKGRRTFAATFAAKEILGDDPNARKADALTAVSEMLKKQAQPFSMNVDSNLAAFDKAHAEFARLTAGLGDRRIEELGTELDTYRLILSFGPALSGAQDKDPKAGPAAALGLGPNLVLELKTGGAAPDRGIRVLERLGEYSRVLPTEGYRMLALSSGPVGNPSPEGGASLSASSYPYPEVEFMGSKKYEKPKHQVYDLQILTIKLKAPLGAKSFSFDFDFFSAEYPAYVKQNFNDSFFAVILAESTNGGKATNIAFDSNNNPIEVDSNYFQNEFHPLPNTGTGFDRNGSTGWLRTSWPVVGGETFILRFSVHDEGDAAYDSLVLLDNFRFHDYAATGTTDPLN